MSQARGHEPAVTPPREEPGRPGVVTAAVVVWTVLGAFMVVTGALYAIALLTGQTDAGTGWLPLAVAMLVFAAAGVGVLVGARRAGRGSRRARLALTAVGGVLVAVGLVMVTFLGGGGQWLLFLAFVAGVVLLHVPPAAAWYTEEAR